MKLLDPGPSPVSPRIFKSNLARFPHHFSGLNQYDCKLVHLSLKFLPLYKAHVLCTLILTRLFRKIHVFIPNPGGARTIFANDFDLLNKGYVKSMAYVVVKKNLLCVPVENHKRIKCLLSEPFFLTSLIVFITKFDKMLCGRMQKLEEKGKSFKVLDFFMEVYITVERHKYDLSTILKLHCCSHPASVLVMKSPGELSPCVFQVVGFAYR